MIQIEKLVFSIEEIMESIKESYNRYLRYFLSKDDSTATPHNRYMAMAYAVRNEMIDNWIGTQNYYHDNNVRRVYYLSTEYLFGKSLRQNIVNTGINGKVADVARDMGFSLEELYSQEDEQNLGGSSRGRLAASFQEAMATRELPAMGYGIRYDYAFFRQCIVNGRQFEKPYDWLHKGHPWEIIRPEYQCIIEYNGQARPATSAEGNSCASLWVNTDKVMAVPSDIPIPGYRCDTVNTVRLWAARATEEFPADYVNHGDYMRACEETSQNGGVTKILFPEGDVIRATESRIRLHYFLISASLQDILRRYKQHNPDITRMAEKVVIQLNGTSCSLAIPEMMRLLVDLEGVPWDTAWNITREIFTYTSHAVNRENLEEWPVYILEGILPRHMAIIYEINFRHLNRTHETEENLLATIQELSLIQEGEVKRVKMGHMAILGSSCVNGVSKTQTEKLNNRLFKTILGASSGKLANITVGTSHRRWLLAGNNLLSDLICEAIGDGWIREPEQLRELEKYAADTTFLKRLGEVKQVNKERLLISIGRELAFKYDSSALFDVQCKKIHPHNRQTLHLLHVVSRYLRIKNGENLAPDRLHVFAGKAMPADFLAKQIIALIHVVAGVVNRDPDMKGRMGIVFVPDYNVSWAEKIIPAVELSEELAMPGRDACMTTSFKMALNGALVITGNGGVNIELAERIGNENIFIFGSPEDDAREKNGRPPAEVVGSDPRLLQVFTFLEELLTSTPGGESIYPLISTMRDIDRYRVIADFRHYAEKMDVIDAFYADRMKWLEASLRTCAGTGWFSVDRMADEYARYAWKVEKTPR